jgi:hypothetical protein
MSASPAERGSGEGSWFPSPGFNAFLELREVRPTDTAVEIQITSDKLGVDSELLGDVSHTSPIYAKAGRTLLYVDGSMKRSFIFVREGMGISPFWRAI